MKLQVAVQTFFYDLTGNPADIDHHTRTNYTEVW